MNGDQSQRTYYEIIDEVGNMLEKEGALYDIDREMIYSIQKEWIKNLEIMKSEPVMNAVEDLKSPDGSFSGDELDPMSEEEYLDKLEKQIGVYMVCFFTKVTKTKTKWKCSFKHGFINIDSHDIPYSTANGEFLQW